MSFDDLAFPSRSAEVQVRKACPSCETQRMFRVNENMCPSCGDRLIVVPEQALNNGGMQNPLMMGHAGAAGAMLQQILASAAAAGAGAGAGDQNQQQQQQQSRSNDDQDRAVNNGEEALIDGSSLASQLQSLFIPSLNSTYSQMVAAQQGIDIEQLMTQLLQQTSNDANAPTSKRFIESLQERALVPRDFVQVYLRFPATLLDRDVFPTIGAFGSGSKFVDAYAQEVEENMKRVQEEEKKEEEEAAAKKAAGTAAATAQPAASDSAPATATSTSDATASSSSSSSSSPTFSSAPREHSSGSLVLSNPLHGKAPLLNGKLFRGAWVMMIRGVVPFAEKVRAAQNLLARGVIVQQSEADEKAWPFVMSDSTGKAGDIIIPCFMISKTDGEAIRAAIEKAKTSPSSSSSSSSSTAALDMSVKVYTRERPLACSICREDFYVGHMAVELPCNHHYCHSCILPWLEKRSNCPVCRFELPTDEPKKKEDLRGPESNHAQLQRDMFT